MTKDWLELCLGNPETHVVKTVAGNWFLSAVGAESLGQLIRNAGKKGLPPTETLARMVPKMEEGTVVFLPSPEFPDPRVLAFKSVICSREIYWVSPSAGKFVLADRLADLLPELPRANRVLSDRRAVHFLLGCNLRGDWTLVEDIHRVGHGELLLFTPGEREPGIRRIQRFSWDSVIEDENESLKVMEKALDRVSGLIGPVGNKAMMFSGGIDSTLLWACVNPRIPALTGFVDTDPAEAETARTAASRHGIEHKVLPVREAEFLEEFRGTLEDVGLPFIISNFQALFYRQAFQSGFSHLVSGELADSLWGITHTARIFKEGENPKYSVSIGNSPLAPGGYGIRVHLLLPDDLGLLERAYGEKTVLDCLDDSLSYALGCLDPAVPLDRDYKKGHADLGSLAFILNGSWRSNYRQAGYVHGVGLSFPFETLSMVRAGLSIALPGRILSKDGQVKPLVRRMLMKKLPGSILPEKSGSGLPRTRYCQEGPFKGFFREHPIPGFWPEEWAELLRNPTPESSSMVLKCASLQLWIEDVLCGTPRLAGKPFQGRRMP